MSETHAATVAYERLSSGARDVMMQLFVTGPTWDGNLISKAGRTELVDYGLAFRTDGWQSLTLDGVTMAATVNVAGWRDQRWHRKQQCL